MSSLQRQPLCFLGEEAGNDDHDHGDGEDDDLDHTLEYDDNDDADDDCQEYEANLFVSIG